jgi:hypothetical protein
MEMIELKTLFSKKNRVSLKDGIYGNIAGILFYNLRQFTKFDF